MQLLKNTRRLALIANCEKIKTFHNMLCKDLDILNTLVEKISDKYEILLELKRNCDSLYEDEMLDIEEEGDLIINSDAWESLANYLFDLELCCADVQETITLVKDTQIPEVEV